MNGLESGTLPSQATMSLFPSFISFAGSDIAILVKALLIDRSEDTRVSKGLRVGLQRYKLQSWVKRRKVGLIWVERKTEEGIWLMITERIQRKIGQVVSIEIPDQYGPMAPAHIAKLHTT